MLRFLVLAFFLASAQGFQVAAPGVSTASRGAISTRMQFGTGNYDESQTKKNFVLSPIAGVSKDYGESKFEESAGAAPAKLLALTFLAGFPAAFAAAIFTASV